MDHRGPSPDFVGRAEEMKSLGASFDAVAAGRAATVLIGGEAGIGKSRLVEEFCAAARAGGAITASGACVPGDGGLPYAPMVGILRDLTRLPGISAVAEALQPLISGTGRAVSGLSRHGDLYAAGTRLVDDVARAGLLESILAYLTDLARESPLVLVFEDVQWADSATTELLDFLTRNLADAAVLLVASYRSEEVTGRHPLRGWLNELARHPRARRISVNGFDRAELAALIGNLIPDQPDWSLVEAVWARSQGNPFFAEELTAARGSASLPEQLHDVIMSRVDALSDDARLLLRVIATAGPVVDHDLLVAIAALTTEPLETALAEAVDKRVLIVVKDAAAYGFRHELMREAVYASLLPGERARLHRGVASALAADDSLGRTTPGYRVAALASHWWSAGAWAEALVPSIAAADAASAVLAFPEALVHLEHVLAALERVPASEVPTGVDRSALLERAADIAFLSDNSPRSVELARSAVDSLDATADPETAARCYALLGRNAWGIADSELALDSYHRAVALIPADRPSVSLAIVLAEEARGLMMMSRYVVAEQRCRDAVAAARAVGSRGPEGHALNTLGCCRAALGFHDEGIDLMRQALAIALELAGPDDIHRAYNNLTHLLLMAGELEEIVTVLGNAVSAGEQVHGIRLNGAAQNVVDALVRLGRFAEAETLLVEIGGMNLGSCVAAPHLLPAAMNLRRGRFDQARANLAVADEVTVAMKDISQRGLIHLYRGELALAEDHPDDAYAEIEIGLALGAGTEDTEVLPALCATGIRAIVEGLDVARAIGRRTDVDKARTLVGDLTDEVDRLVGMVGEAGGRPRPALTATAALCRAERSRIDRSDPELWAAAAASWAAANEVYPLAYCRWREAEALLAGRAERARAVASLQTASGLAGGMGALPLQRQIEELARRARVQLGSDDDATPVSTVADDLGLTPRELEVLSQLACGRTDREIAEALFISRKTASVHVSNLLRKLDVTNRVGAGKIGQAHGLGS